MTVTTVYRDTPTSTIGIAAHHRVTPNARLTLYPDAGHGGIFQYHEEFVAEALAFLAGVDVSD